MECSVAPEWWIVFFLEDKESNTTQLYNSSVFVPPDCKKSPFGFLFSVSVCVQFEEVMDGRERLGVLKRNFRMRK